jgi:hypothetical protein
MSELRQWARVKPDLNYRIRRGAWYRVLRVNQGEAVLEVNQRDVTVPLTALQILSTRPPVWTVVSLPRDAIDIPFSWGSRYAVCPSCSHRAALTQRVPAMRCQSCNGEFQVAWSEKYWS